MLQAFRTQLLTLLDSPKDVKTPALMSLTNVTSYDVFPEIHMTVDCGSSEWEKQNSYMKALFKSGFFKGYSHGSFAVFLDLNWLRNRTWYLVYKQEYSFETNKRI